MGRKYKNPKKPNIVSVRITDEEMAMVQQLMDATSKRASELMREAFLMFKAEWQPAGMAGAPVDSGQTAACP